MTMVNNVIEVINYVIAAALSLRNFMIADNRFRSGGQYGSEFAPVDDLGGP